MGKIIYEGPSLIDGKPIVCILTDNSDNEKTGDMVQSWILRADVDPWQAVKDGDDSSICGDCPHRGKDGKERSCYVTVWQAPLSVWKAYKRGSYQTIQGQEITDYCSGKLLRVGSYGDPAAVPLFVWEIALEETRGNTGYTHQWKHCDPGYLSFCMASADSTKEHIQAHKMGYRTFRIRTWEPIQGREFVCPASEEAGKRLTCEQCLACSGNKRGRVSPTIIAHGTGSKYINLQV